MTSSDSTPPILEGGPRSLKVIRGGGSRIPRSFALGSRAGSRRQRAYLSRPPASKTASSEGR